MGRPELGVDAGLQGRKEDQVSLRARAFRSPRTMKQVAGWVTLCGPCFSSVEGAQDPHGPGLRRQSRGAAGHLASASGPGSVLPATWPQASSLASRKGTAPQSLSWVMGRSWGACSRQCEDVRWFQRQQWSRGAGPRLGPAALATTTCPPPPARSSSSPEIRFTHCVVHPLKVYV